VLKSIYDFFNALTTTPSSRSCPYTGKLECFNVTLNHQFLMFIPTGTFRFTYHWWNGKKELMVWSSVLVKIEN
jgi:hypothetical protein